MSLLLRITAVLVVFGMMACAPIQPQIQLPPERSYHRGLSLVPLNEKGWVIRQQDYNTLRLSKHGSRENESYVMFTSILGLPHLTSQKDFINVVEKIETEKLDPSRFTILKQDVIPYPKKGDYCARSYAVLEDRAAVQRTGGTQVMIMDVISLYCQHPEDANVAVFVGYSHRHFPGNEDPAFMEKAERLFDSFEFSVLLPNQEDKQILIPDFNFIDLKGEEVHLKDYKGKIIILNLFATWCPPCKQEIHHFVELTNKYKKDLTVIGFAYDKSDVTTVTDFAEEMNINYRLCWGSKELFDYSCTLPWEHKKTTDAVCSGGVPLTIVIDKTGYVVNNFFGYRDKSTIEKIIKSLL